MRFLKTLQKREAELTGNRSEVDEPKPNGAKKRRGKNHSADNALVQQLKFGKPQTPVSTEVDAHPDSNRQVFETKSEDVLSKAASIEVATSLVNSRIVALTQPDSSFCEEYRSLRTQILDKSRRKKLQSIVVASVVPGEGKSITALNLSWLLAQTDGINALIIDCDLRRPCLTEYLGIETDVGLSDVLDGRLKPLQTIVRLEPAGLYLLPGGQRKSDVAELLSGPKFGEVLSAVRDLFDFVIIDAPPLGIFTDASVLINQTDGALLVVRADHSTYSSMERILERLPREKMIGAVLNHSDDLIGGDSHYYDYYYPKNSY